jgi:hypothetical protein
MCYDEKGVAVEYWGLEKCAYEYNRFAVDAVEYMKCLKGYSIKLT